MHDQPEMPSTSATDEAPILPPAVAEYVAAHTRTYHGGQAYAVDEGGFARFHSSRDGCPNWSVDDLIIWTKSNRPALWTENTNTDA